MGLKAAQHPFEGFKIMTISNDTWIFGFGSLVHNPGFDYSDVVDGYIEGYRRVFFQGSTDHRGTPSSPGRTVTLVKYEKGIVWGRAYKLAGDHQQQQATLQYLEWREKQYDLREYVDVFNKDGDKCISMALVYIATPSNQNWLGPAEEDHIAHQIATAHGPSGPNWEYLFKLADAMRGMGCHDDAELYQLEQKVRDKINLM